MYEECYERLPDVDAYLARIGVLRRGEPKLAYLDELIEAHQCAVPFEDLDISEKRAGVSLGIAALFEKVVVRHRGGYCFELNALFAALLRELGFDVRAGTARIKVRPTVHFPLTHRVNIATIGDADYLVDVGFGGPMPGFALKLQHGYRQCGRGQTFGIAHAGDHQWDLFYEGLQGQTNPMRFSAVPSEECDFVALSYYMSTAPESHFVKTRLVNLRTPEGSRDIRGTTYTERANGHVESFEITSDVQLDTILADRFAIANWR